MHLFKAAKAFRHAKFYNLRTGYCRIMLSFSVTQFIVNSVNNFFFFFAFITVLLNLFVSNKLHDCTKRKINLQLIDIKWQFPLLFVQYFFPQTRWCIRNFCKKRLCRSSKEAFWQNFSLTLSLSLYCPLFRKGCGGQQLEIKPPHFTVFHQLYHLAWVEVPSDSNQDHPCNWLMISMASTEIVLVCGLKVRVGCQNRLWVNSDADETLA